MPVSQFYFAGETYELEMVSILQVSSLTEIKKIKNKTQLTEVIPTANGSFFIFFISQCFWMRDTGFAILHAFINEVQSTTKIV